MKRLRAIYRLCAIRLLSGCMIGDKEWAKIWQDEAEDYLRIINAIRGR